ncbi:MAG: nitrophenyl compound nitroreductase subunit ArsF family protein [Sumerlaeia bacterium]
MKPKVIVTAALLLFVGISLAAIVVKEMGAEPAPAAATPSVPDAASPAEARTAEALPSEAPEETRFVVYYFHGNLRCKTCTNIENQSHDAITTMFADQLASGELEWRLVNFDTPEYEHFRDDFQLAFQSVVLAEERGGKIVRWENLADVWTKILGSPREFEEYVVDSTVTFMAGGA